MVQNLCALLNDKRNRPGEEVHEVGQQIWMRTVDELLNVERIALDYHIFT